MRMLFPTCAIFKHSSHMPCCQMAHCAWSHNITRNYIDWESTPSIKDRRYCTHNYIRYSRDAPRRPFVKLGTLQIHRERVVGLAWWSASTAGVAGTRTRSTTWPANVACTEPVAARASTNFFRGWSSLLCISLMLLDSELFSVLNIKLLSKAVVWICAADHDLHLDIVVL